MTGERQLRCGNDSDGAFVPVIGPAAVSQVEEVETHGCSITLRRIAGPAATEFHLHCQPPAHATEAGSQATAIYSALLDVLAAKGGGFESVVTETILLRDLSASLASVRASRRKIVGEKGSTMHDPATTAVEQPPLDERACLEVMVHAVLPHRATARFESIRVAAPCRCDECACAHGLALRLGDEVRFHAGGLCGTGQNAYEQTLAMFGHAERLLRQAGLEFTDVVRTWIHLRHMERDYPALNRARREFFAARGIHPVPASTGIHGGPASDAHDLCLGLYAVKSSRPLKRTVMSSPTLNEAGDYGADFARGMKVVETNKVALHVSGTASIDEQGKTAHVGDFDAQVERMLENIAALLERQGANFGDVVSAITYLKHPADAGRLRMKLRDAGFGGFPHALVAAEICRPDLLCETEALAVVPTNDGPRLPPQS
jgi:enamine deaminase RidA (YjgF/YER057c/UK114 family)